MAVPRWVKDKGFSTWKGYMASIRPLRRKKRKKNPGEAWHRRKRRENQVLRAKSKVTRSKFFHSGKVAAHYESELAAGSGTNPSRTHKKRTRKNPIVVYNPKPQVVLYQGEIELRGRRAIGSYKGKRFKHAFKARSQVQIVGLSNGELLIRSLKKVPLWGAL